jgi:hypothetical protein
MAAMHAVKGTDREYATTVPRTQIMQAPNKIHRGRALQIRNQECIAL